jgi:excisionase family DNA binding protein
MGHPEIVSEILRTLATSLERTADLLDRLDELTSESPLTVDEVASALRVDERTVRRYIADGRLYAFQVGNQYRIPRSSLAQITRKEPGGAATPPGTNDYLIRR